MSLREVRFLRWFPGDLAEVLGVFEVAENPPLNGFLIQETSEFTDNQNS